MNPEWDGLLLDCRLATMTATGAPYGLVEAGALGWKDGTIAYVGARAALPDAPERLAARVVHAKRKRRAWSRPMRLRRLRVPAGG